MIEGVIGFLLGVIAFLTGLFVVSERKRKLAESKGAESNAENIELKAKDEVQGFPLDDLIKRHNDDIKSRRNQKPE